MEFTTRLPAASRASLALALLAMFAGGCGSPDSLQSMNGGAREVQAGFNLVISENAGRMMEEGRDTFRYATFGSEGFWGDALGLHQAIEGSANGGVGAGV